MVDLAIDKLLAWPFLVLSSALLAALCWSVMYWVLTHTALILLLHKMAGFMTAEYSVLKSMLKTILTKLSNLSGAS